MKSERLFDRKEKDQDMGGGEVTICEQYLQAIGVLRQVARELGVQIILEVRLDCSPDWCLEFYVLWPVEAHPCRRFIAEYVSLALPEEGGEYTVGAVKRELEALCVGTKNRVLGHLMEEERNPRRG